MASSSGTRSTVVNLADKAVKPITAVDGLFEALRTLESALTTDAADNRRGVEGCAILTVTLTATTPARLDVIRCVDAFAFSTR
jgi:hypothetical protein